MNIIVAVAKNGVIGQGLEIPWHYPADFKWFKELTLHGVLIMGRKTFDSLPKKKLPQREIIVVSRMFNFYPNQVGNLQDACYLARTRWPEKKVWFAGGAQIYKEALDLKLVERIYYTEIPEEPTIDENTILFPKECLKGFGYETGYSNSDDTRLIHKTYRCL